MNQLLDWQGQTAVVLASGWSLTEDQVRHVENREVKTIAVNSTHEMMTIPDVVYAGDYLFWKVNHRKVGLGMAHEPSLWTQDSTAAQRYHLNRVKGVNKQGLGRTLIHTNGNSGAQAINLAYLFGACRILLLGFDMQPGPNGERHWHPDHNAPMVQAQTFGEWIHKMEFLARDLKAAGCEVINCTTRTVLTCFPISTIEKELP